MSVKNTVKRTKIADTVKKLGGTASNTGTPEVQVALITNRINELNQHFTTHKKDFHSQRGLLKLVGQRRRLLTYLKNCDAKRYNQLIQTLELRK